MAGRRRYSGPRQNRETNRTNKNPGKQSLAPFIVVGKLFVSNAARQICAYRSMARSFAARLAPAADGAKFAYANRNLVGES